MTSFFHTITDKLGIHARPAGLLAKRARPYTCAITLVDGEKQADMKSIFSLMGLQAKHGHQVEVVCSGPDEALAARELKQVFLELL